MHAAGVGCVHVTVAYWESARAVLSNLGDWNQLFRAHSDLIAPARSPASIREIIAQGRIAVIFGFQHCKPLEEELHLVEIYRELGVAFMQLSYNNQSPCAAGCFEPEDSGLARFGREVVAEMNRVGMIVDMAHSGRRSTREAIDYSRRPIAISHANPRFFADTPRNVSEDVLDALAARGGMLGFSAYPAHLAGGAQCSLEAFCTMIARTAERTGTACLGLGTDLCQGQPDSVVAWMRHGRWQFADWAGVHWPAAPAWFASNRDFPTIAEGLRRVGFDDAEIAGIMGGNWLRFLDDALVPASHQ